MLTPHQEKISKNYPIAFKDDQVKESVNTLLETFDLVPMNAYDRHDKVIPPDQLSKKLKGALVQVVFTLHYTLVFQDKSNTFRGSIVEVKVLKRAPVVMSPVRKGPLKFEDADVRQEQIQAVKNFLMPKEFRQSTQTPDVEPEVKKRKTTDEIQETPSKPFHTRSVTASRASTSQLGASSSRK